ncbi:MAG TPA: YciI family protein [Iamia sp.]
MPQFMLSVWHDDDYVVDFTSDEGRRRVRQVSALNREMEAAGAWVFGVGLEPASSASAFRADGAGVSMTDGPYAETKEQMGGFWVIEVPDRETAEEWARQATVAGECPVEVRPVQGA